MYHLYKNIVVFVFCFVFCFLEQNLFVVVVVVGRIAQKRSLNSPEEKVSN